MLKHSKAYLRAMFEQYVPLACENLGISTDTQKVKENTNTHKKTKQTTIRNSALDEDSYPIKNAKKPNVSQNQPTTKTGDFIDDYLKNFEGVII